MASRSPRFARDDDVGSVQENSSGEHYGKSNCHRVSGWNVPRLHRAAEGLAGSRRRRSARGIRSEADIRKTCDELAEQGFIAAAPDLCWRQEPGVDLSVTSEPDWQHGFRLNQAYDRDAGAKDVKDTADVVAKLPE